MTTTNLFAVFRLAASSYRSSCSISDDAYEHNNHQYSQEHVHRHDSAPHFPMVEPQAVEQGIFGKNGAIKSTP